MSAPVANSRTALEERSVADEAVAARFWAKVARRGDDECWEWLGTKLPRGYGTFGYGSLRPERAAIVGQRRKIKAHRFSYALNIGPIPRGQCVMHRCDNPPCVNPKHLTLGSVRDNHVDMMRKGRHMRGSMAPQSKLNDEAVRWMRFAHAFAGVTCAVLAEAFGVSQPTAAKAISGRTWRQVTKPISTQESAHE